MIDTPVMRYFGGKFRIADWIQSYFPPHTCYVEPFGGAASVLMQKPRSYSEVYNDMDGEIVNVFRVLRDPESAEQLAEACRVTPFARDEYALAQEPSSDPIEQARRTLFRAAAGFGSAAATKGSSGFRCDSKRNYALVSHVWARYPDNIAQFCQRLQGVIVENRPALDIIAQHDGAETLFYLDPPYIHDTRDMSNRYYRHEMSNDEHRELLGALMEIEGMAVLSGYPHEIYSDLLEQAGWRFVSRYARASAGKGTKVATEGLWINRPAARRGGQQSLFSGGAA